jgi:hypothetical protein
LAKLILHLDKSVFLDRYSSFKDRFDHIKVGAFRYDFSIKGFAIPYSSGVCVAINDVAPTIQNGAFKRTEATVFYIELVIATI